jgi:membrane protein involved in colicin uptake
MSEEEFKVALVKAQEEADAKAKSEAEAKLKTEADAKAAANKKVTITCVKGKLTKKFTGVSPKCPSGYRKK